jgi:hypothetical protein
MPTPVIWHDDEHSIIKVTITPTSTWDEYYQVIAWIVTEVTQVDHRVDIVFNDDVGLPKGNHLTHLKWGSQKIISLSNAGHTIIAGSQGASNSFFRMMMLAVAKYFMKSATSNDPSKQLLFMPDLEAALAYIKSIRNLDR